MQQGDGREGSYGGGDAQQRVTVFGEDDRRFLDAPQQAPEARQLAFCTCRSDGRRVDRAQPRPLVSGVAKA